MTPISHTAFIPNTEGIFEIPSSIYHNHKEAPEISRSLVVEMVDTCPEAVKAVIDGRRKKKITPAMISGTLIDLALLEPDKFREGLSHWIMPEGLDLRTKDGKAWKEDHPNLPALRLKTDDPGEASAEDIQGMIESVMRHKIMRRIVERSVKQESAFCFDPDTGLLRKCRPDARLVDNSGKLTLADLKSTFLGGTSKHTFSSHCARMGYFIQDPFYSDVYKDLTGEEPYFIFGVVERKPPYLVRVFQIHSKGKQAGRDQYKRALEQYAECKATGIWPSYPEEIVQIELPRWAVEPKGDDI